MAERETGWGQILWAGGGDGDLSRSVTTLCALCPQQGELDAPLTSVDPGGQEGVLGPLC